MLGRPGGRGDEDDGGLTCFFESGEAILDLGGDLHGRFVGGTGQGEFYIDAVLLRDSGDSCAGSFGVRLDRDGADEAEVDYVAGEHGIVAVAQGGEDVRLGKHRGLFRGVPPILICKDLKTYGLGSVFLCRRSKSPGKPAMVPVKISIHGS